MSITLNWNSSVVETNTLVSFSVHCLVHLGHTYHTYTQTLHSAMSRQPSLLPVATTSSLTARYVAHTLERLLAYAVVVDRPLRCTWSVVRLLAYAVVVDRPFRCTHGRTPARIRRRREVTNALYHCTAVSEYSRPRRLPHSNCGYCQAGRSTLRSTLRLYNTHVA